MDALLVTGTALAGVVLGGALDPVGQRFADQSRAEDEARRAEDRRRREAEGAVPDDGAPVTATGERGPVAVPEVPPPTVASDVRAAAVPDGPPPGEEPSAPGLVPGGRSPARRAVAALVTGVLFGGAAAHFGADVILAPFCVFFALLVVVSVTDLSHRLVPRRLLYAAMAVVVPLLVVTSAVDHRWHSLSGSVVAGAVAFGLFFLVWWFVPQGMGFGDVRLAGAIGVTVGYLSLLHAYVAFLVGFLIGTVFGLVMVAVLSSGRKTRIPFGPSLAAGAVFAVLWGGPVAHSVFHAGS